MGILHAAGTLGITFARSNLEYPGQWLEAEPSLLRRRSQRMTDVMGAKRLSKRQYYYLRVVNRHGTTRKHQANCWQQGREQFICCGFGDIAERMMRYLTSGHSDGVL